MQVFACQVRSDTKETENVMVRTANTPAYVAGVGTTRFTKPGEGRRTYVEMVADACSEALADAGITYERVEHAVAGFVYAPSTAGQRSLYGLGLTGIPITNVNNNCSTGSTALMHARTVIEAGMADVVLAVGFEQMTKGSLDLSFPGTVSPLDQHFHRLRELYPPTDSPLAPQLWARAADDHMKRYGSSPVDFAMVAEKNHRHSVNNERAQFRQAYSLEEILDSPMVDPPLTRLQCSPTSDGAAAAVLVSANAVEDLDLAEQAIRLAGQAMATDTCSSFARGDAIDIVGTGMSQRAAAQASEHAGFGVTEVDVIELHDCFSSNEILTYEALGMCEAGEGPNLLRSGDTTYGGRWVVNPSGGLISKGHPLGATGIAQCAELTWQLRGQAGSRQVPGARRALQHNVGLGGAAVVTLYEVA